MMVAIKKAATGKLTAVANKIDYPNT